MQAISFWNSIVADRPTSRPTDIATYRAAIAAKKIKCKALKILPELFCASASIFPIVCVNKTNLLKTLYTSKVEDKLPCRVYTRSPVVCLSSGWIPMMDLYICQCKQIFSSVYRAENIFFLYAYITNYRKTRLDWGWGKRWTCIELWVWFKNIF